MDSVGEIVPVWRANFPREIIPISEMLLKARIGTAGHLLMGLFIRRRERSALRPGGQLRTISSLCRCTVYSLEPNLQLRV